ncbi:hypothetical protein FGE21_07040 [Phaeobacter sp. B1627]|nr:hypothetical protein FGE21_07040 [Phaeobacter sp. B1627]
MAGAWMEQEGAGFLSSGFRLRPSGQELSTYGSYGIGPRLTLGLDINQAEDSGSRSAHALIFARLPLRQHDTGWRLALEVAVGANRDTSPAAQWSAMQRVTLSAGRGLRIAGRDGWAAFDLSAEWQNAGLTQAWKLDGTLGLNAPSGPAPLLQVELYQPRGGDLLWKLLPGLRFRLTPQRELVTGLEIRSFGDARYGLRMELWHRF